MSEFIDYINCLHYESPLHRIQFVVASFAFYDCSRDGWFYGRLTFISVIAHLTGVHTYVNTSSPVSLYSPDKGVAFRFYWDLTIDLGKVVDFAAYVPRAYVVIIRNHL